MIIYRYITQAACPCCIPVSPCVELFHTPLTSFVCCKCIIWCHWQSAPCASDDLDILHKFQLFMHSHLEQSSQSKRFWLVLICLWDCSQKDIVPTLNFGRERVKVICVTVILQDLILHLHSISYVTWIHPYWMVWYASCSFAQSTESYVCSWVSLH